MHSASREDIQKFLSSCVLIAENSFFLAKRVENEKTIRELGFDKKVVKEIILSLRVEDYSEGPCPDRNYKNDVWIFGVVIDGKEIYIKLQISSYNNPGELVPTLYCVSFHFAEQKMDFPYKE
jgi:hypothetical protein